MVKQWQDDMDRLLRDLLDASFFGGTKIASKSWSMRSRPPKEERQKGLPTMAEKKPLEVETDQDVFYDLTVTLGVRALRNSDGTIRKVTCTDAWADRPDWLDKGVHLLQLELQVPASFFGYIPKAKGKLESKIVEEFNALITELED